MTGVVLAATDSNPADIGKDSLVLNGYPPHSANLAVTVSTGVVSRLNATVTANFTDNRRERARELSASSIRPPASTW